MVWEMLLTQVVMLVEGGTSMEMLSCIRGWSQGLVMVVENWLSLLRGATSEGC